MDSSAGKPNMQEFERQLEQVNPGLRDPAAVVELIRITGASYQENLVNTLDKYRIYLFDSVLSAMNLGIYTVDVAYLVTYQREKEVMIYLNIARELAENIGAGHLYDHGMFRRYQVAGAHEDSLKLILKHAAEQFIEAVLYDVNRDLKVNDNSMVWLGHSTLVNPSSLQDAAVTFTERMVGTLVNDGVITTIAKEKIGD